MSQGNIKYGYIGEFNFYTNNQHFRKNSEKTIMLEIIHNSISAYNIIEKIKEISQNKFVINFLENNSLINKFNILNELSEKFKFIKNSLTDEEKQNIVKIYLKTNILNKQQKIYNEYLIAIGLYEKINMDVNINECDFFKPVERNNLFRQYCKLTGLVFNNSINDLRKMHSDFLQKKDLKNWSFLFEKLFDLYIIKNIKDNSYNYFDAKIRKIWKEIQDYVKELYKNTSIYYVHYSNEYKLFSKFIREKYDNEYCIYEFEHLFERKIRNPSNSIIVNRGYFKIYISNYFNIYYEVKDSNGLIFINKKGSISLANHLGTIKKLSSHNFKFDNKFILDNYSIDLIKKFGIKKKEIKRNNGMEIRSLSDPSLQWSFEYYFELNFNPNSLLTRKELQIMNDDFLSKTIETNKKLMDDNRKLKEENEMVKEEIENIKKKFEDKYLNLYNEKKSLNLFKNELQNVENENEKQKEEIKEKLLKIGKANYILLKNKEDLEKALKRLKIEKENFEKEKEKFEKEKELFHSDNLNTIDVLIDKNCKSFNKILEKYNKRIKKR